MYFDSRRSTVLATNGMVATSQPLAAMAGLQALVDGGNAVDAAITAAAALNVVEPNSTGVGGDLFALVWNEKEKSVRAINGSGRAPVRLQHRGADLPGLPRHARRRALFGRCTGHRSRLGNPAGQSAAPCPFPASLSRPSATPRKAFPVSEVIAWQWENNLPKLRSRTRRAQEMLLVNGDASEEWAT